MKLNFLGGLIDELDDFGFTFSLQDPRLLDPFSFLDLCPFYLNRMYE